jgi:hypothetical protein
LEAERRVGDGVHLPQETGELRIDQLLLGDIERRAECAEQLALAVLHHEQLAR